jgi:hypothetical protein
LEACLLESLYFRCYLGGGCIALVRREILSSTFVSLFSFLLFGYVHP